MATATKSFTRIEWQARAVALADQHHLLHRARFIGTGVVDEALYSVPSRSAEGSCHIVRLYQHTGQITCTCHAGVFGRACSHVGAAIVADRQRLEALRAPQDEAMRSFCNGMGW